MRLILVIALSTIFMGTAPVVKGQDPSKIEDAPKIFLNFFKLNKEDKKRTTMITKLIKKRKRALEKTKDLTPAQEKEHARLKRDVAIWSKGYNVYKMTDDEKELAAKHLGLK